MVIALDWSKPSTMVSVLTDLGSNGIRRMIELYLTTQVRELLTWLRWVSSWITASAKRDEQDELRERCALIPPFISAQLGSCLCARLTAVQHHVQNYSEPSSSTSYQGSSPYAGSGAVLPLGQGVLTLNLGVPIIVVCTRADRMDVVGDELGMKGQWEERTDWVQQALRTICLACESQALLLRLCRYASYSGRCRGRG